jgi:hypothetical protein
MSAVSASYKTAVLLSAAASTPRRGKVAEIIIGAIGNPNTSTDTYLQFDLSRLTTIASWTTTAFTPVPVDFADAACNTVAGVNASAEGSVTASSSMFNDGINQRGTFRWIETDESKMLIWPATANNGVALRVLSNAYTNGASGQIGFLE